MNKYFNAKFFTKIIPPIMCSSFLSFLVRLNFFFFVDKEIFIKNKNLKNTAEGKRGFLLATGPSIKKQNLKRLAKSDCFSLSSFFYHKDIKTINPKFHFLAPYHKPILIKEWKKWVKQADENLPKETNFVLHVKDKKNILKYKLLKNRQIFYLYFSKFINLKNDLDITKPLPDMQSSPLMALPFMIYMGYKEICLVGCDFDNLKNYGYEIKNFYNQKIQEKKAESKPWYLGIIKELENNLSAIKQFNNYQIFTKKRNIKIINLSKESWLDFYEKKNFNLMIR